MRSKTTAQIVAASNKADDHLNASDPVAMFYPWTPVVDGVLVDGQPITLFSQGKFNRIPIMLGNVEEEALLFIWEVFLNPVDKAGYIASIDAVYGSNSAAVLSYYPPTPYNWTDYRYIMNQVGTDWIFSCANRYVAKGIYTYGGGVPLYVYRFNNRLSFDAWGPNYTECVNHVCHGIELVYLYQSEGLGGFAFTDQEQLMADAFGAMWGNFAHTGNPNTAGVGAGFDNYNSVGQAALATVMVGCPWPLWTPSTGDYRITIATPTNSQVFGFRQQFCDFWDTIPYLTPKPPTN
jgi:acetylcholinesterase/cholinesterase